MRALGEQQVGEAGLAEIERAAGLLDDLRRLRHRVGLEPRQGSRPAWSAGPAARYRAARGLERRAVIGGVGPGGRLQRRRVVVTAVEDRQRDAERQHHGLLLVAGDDEVVVGVRHADGGVRHGAAAGHGRVGAERGDLEPRDLARRAPGERLIERLIVWLIEGLIGRQRRRGVERGRLGEPVDRARRVEQRRAQRDRGRDIGVGAAELELERLGIELDPRELGARQIGVIAAHLLEHEQRPRGLEVGGDRRAPRRHVGELAQGGHRLADPRAERPGRQRGGLVGPQLRRAPAAAALAELEQLADARGGLVV